MAKKKCLLLKATEYNWGLKGPGDWIQARWHIFRDGSYEIITTFNPSFDDLEETEKKQRPKASKKKTAGVMDKDAFTKLLKAIQCETWGDQTADADACDGVSWAIEAYREDGSIEKISGEPDAIDGYHALETIVSLLPDDKNYDGGNAAREGQ